jgi:hypothetical protein
VCYTMLVKNLVYSRCDIVCKYIVVESGGDNEPWMCGGV